MSPLKLLVSGQQQQKVLDGERDIYIVRFCGVAKKAMINNSPQENYEHEKQDCDRTRLTKTS